MKIYKSLSSALLAISISACCGGGGGEPSRWDENNKNKPTSATATNKPNNKPTETPPSKPSQKKEEESCKKFNAGSVNKAFPEGSSGYKRIYKADKDGYAEAEYTKGKETLTLTITHAPEKKDEYSSVSSKVSGFPYKTFGKNKSNLFVKDCYLLSASSKEIAEDGRKDWLGKFHFSALP